MAKLGLEFRSAWCQQREPRAKGWGWPKRSKHKVSLSPHALRLSWASTVLGWGVGEWVRWIYQTIGYSPCLTAAHHLLGEAGYELDEVKTYSICRNLLLLGSIEFKSEFCHFLAVWPWESHSIFLDLNFFNYKMEMKNYSYFIGLLGRPHKAHCVKYSPV